MSETLLFVMTSHADLGDSGIRTGTWMEELASAYYIAIDAGADVRLASIKGGAAPIDPASLEQPWFTAVGKRFQQDLQARDALAATIRLAEVDPAAFDAVYFVGGAGAAWDFPDDKDVKRVVESIDRAGGVLSGVCHGVLGITAATSRDGTPLVAGKKVTAVSNAEEVITTFDTVVPVLPEDRLVELGGIYSKASEPFGAHIAIDGNLITGQNPESASLVARAVLARIREKNAQA